MPLLVVLIGVAMFAVLGALVWVVTWRFDRMSERAAPADPPRSLDDPD